MGDLQASSKNLSMETPAAILSIVPPVVIDACAVLGNGVTSPVPDALTGRVKAPPICNLPELRKEAFSALQLTEMCFSASAPASMSAVHDDAAHVSCSSSSSTCSKESNGHGLGTVALEENIQKSEHIRKISAVENAKVLGRKTSRQGRSGQRWATDPKTHQNLRLVTGCVPIMKGGRILFITASRKREWILPKGGWEIDESLQESAIRETFEEAGVIGVLGQNLTEIDYETRKGKKRRLDLEETTKKFLKERSDVPCSDVLHSEDEHQVPRELLAYPATGVSPQNPNSSGPLSPNDDRLLQPQEIRDSNVKEEATLLSHSSSSSADLFRRIQALKKEALEKHGPSDETASLASDGSATHSHVRMTLFPLYVSDVKEVWPESGRLRKVLDIDEGIKMLESRPEFRAALIEVKEKGLHLLSDPVEQAGKLGTQLTDDHE